MKIDFYEVLEIEKTASGEEIKKSYRKLAMKYHPDRASDDKKDLHEAKFKEINEAYQTLSDPQKRQQYDRFGSTGGTGGFGGGGFGGGGVDVDFGDIFEQFFGGQGGNNRSRRRSSEQVGEDLEMMIDIDLKTSIYGGKKDIKVNKRVSCKKCSGAGGEGKKTCGKCKGSGQITYTSQSLFGVIQQTAECDDCNGTGETFETICTDCNGTKRKVESKTIDLDIPAGIDNGMVIKLEGEGNDGIGTKQSGSLYLKFRVNLEEKGLKRKASDLFYEIEIDTVEAVLGTKKEINIPVIGKRLIDIKSGTQSGDVLEITGDGVKHIDSDQKGDLFITITIKIPKKLSKKEKELYLEIAAEKKINVNNHKGIFEKIFG